MVAPGTEDEIKCECLCLGIDFLETVEDSPMTSGELSDIVVLNSFRIHRVMPGLIPNDAVQPVEMSAPLGYQKRIK